MRFQQCQSQIGLGTLSIHVKRLIKESLCLFPFAVRQRHIAALDLGCHIRVGNVLHNNCFFCRSCGLFSRVQNLADAARQVLHKTDFSHVIALQHRQCLGQIVGVHIAVAGQQQLAAILFHHGKKTTPLVLDPDRVEIFRLGANYNHNFGRVQRCKNVRFVLGADLILQRNARKEYTPTLIGQLVVDFLRKGAVLGAAAVLVAFLVADEHIKRLFILAGGKYTVLDFGNFSGVFLILAPRNAVRILQCRLIVHILQETVKAGTVAGGQIFVRGRVLDILNAVAAERAAPVRLGIGVVLFHYVFIHSQCLVKFTDPAEIVAAVKRRRPLVIVQLGECHRTAAALADTKGLIGGKLDVSSAHFALDNCHSFTSFTILFV